MKRICSTLNEETIKNLRAFDEVLLSGTILTARDAAHKRLFDLIKKGEELPVSLKNKIIYYTGPSPTPPEKIIGACGPTSSYRMDKFTPTLLKLGLKGMIGKGDRSKEVIDSIIENKCVYFVAIGGTAALISKSVTDQKVICYENLQTEAIRAITVKDMPLIVAIDCFGNNIYSR